MLRLLIPIALLSLVLTACQERALAPPILEATTTAAVAAGDDPTTVAPDAVTTPASGAREPLVVVTIFADAQCPFCRAAEELSDKLLRHWPDVVQVQFRQLPLEQMHPLARAAAIANLAAHRQGRYACLSHALYATQDAWQRDDEQLFRARVLALAEEACHVDPVRFEADMRDPALSRAVDADLDRAEAASVNATPTFLVNGVNVRARTRGTDDSLPSAVRRELALARKAIADGADRAEWLRERVGANLGEVRGADWLLDDRLP
ncbi:MAG: hypothetical protein CVU56_25945 [Deltaproteobacteria bacterium HGW-Deltaproteobacteria-14]|jgi:protein-disulfide isomerase|nr:MAG: hypothetical protein CVU56_25945 [Deltaproteobacteria bacterium HGW-Deltaproteobacteria-14]